MRTLLGRILWTENDGVVVDTRDVSVRRALTRAIATRIRQGRYYIAAAVRTAERVTGLELDRVGADVPEVLRCIAADSELWKSTIAGRHLTIRFPS